MMPSLLLRPSIAAIAACVACKDFVHAQNRSIVQWGPTTSAPVASPGPYASVNKGHLHSLALRNDGRLLQWGDTNSGQSQNAPPEAGPYKAIEAGAYHSLALRSDGSLVQWGATNLGQATNAPAAAGPYIAIAAGWRHSLALRSDGSLVQWGSTEHSQALNAPPAAGPYIAIAAGETHSVALRADGSLVQWGRTSSGQATNAPPAAGPYIAIAAGLYHNIALKADGSLVQWGGTNSGQATNAPPAAGPYIAITAGNYHSLALRSDGALVQWGMTAFGQATNTPPSAGPYRAIAAGGETSVAIPGAPDRPVRFSYQGRLAGIAGPVDLRMTIFNQLAGGWQIGSATRIDGAVTTSEGTFSVIVDPGVIDLAVPLWIEIAVAPAGSGAFVTLSPRQPIAPAPVAGFALAADAASIAGAASLASRAASVPWTGITGAPTNVSSLLSAWQWNAGNLGFAGGNVGIGTTSPSYPLHVVRSGTTVPLVQIESNASTGTWLNLVNSSPGGTHWHLISTGSDSVSGAGKLAIGWGATPVEHNPVMTLQQANGNVGIGVTTPSQRLHVAGNVLANAYQTVSSARFKRNVRPISDALDKLLQLEGVTFDWKPEFAAERQGREHDIGFIAEDVAKVFPEIISRDANDEVSGVDYSRLVAVAVQAIKQQHALRVADRAAIDAAQAELSRLDADTGATKREIDDLKTRLERLEAKLK